MVERGGGWSGEEGEDGVVGREEAGVVGRGGGGVVGRE